MQSRTLIPIGHNVLSPSNVVVAYDGLPVSDLALEVACRLVRALDGRLDLVHVLEEGAVEYAAEAKNLSKEEASDFCMHRKADVFSHALEVCRRMGFDSSASAEANLSTTLIRAGSVVEGVMAHADSCAADLIIAQPSPHLEELRLDIVHRLMASSSLPLLVVQGNRQRLDTAELPAVLIPLDEKLQTVVSACFGIRLAAAIGHRVIIAHVMPLSSGDEGGQPTPVIRSAIAMAEGVAGKFSVPTEVHFASGPSPDLALIRLAMLQRAQLVVMRRSASTLVGSTADLLLRNSKQNVLLINEAKCVKCYDCPVGRFAKENDEATR
jgi:nucleotide-binding universal stress UspA family protein